MWNPDTPDLPPGPEGPAAAPSPSRINVAVTGPMLSAIDRVIDTDDVSLTEAVRRLLCFGDFVYELQHTPGHVLIVRDELGRERQVVPA